MIPTTAPSPGRITVAVAILPLALFAGCGKHLCPDDMVLDSQRSQAGKVAFCTSRADRSRATWIQSYDSGQHRQVCPFLGGRPGGTYHSWHKNGTRWLEGRYLNGLKDGRWAQWSEDGHPVGDGEYRDGALVQGAPVGTPATCEAVIW
ncbi:MAG: hypothetical protein QOI66_4926 [Myxococcales bacterium]|nr:hypothetical protein [Myxococcales bacterium]